MNTGSLVTVCIFLGIIAWNVYGYIQGKEAQAFVDIYNPHITQIATNLEKLEANFLKIENDILDGTITIEEEASAIMQENTPYYESVIQSANILESQACTLLKHSMNECIDFVTTYKDLMKAFQSEDYEATATISYEILPKSNIFTEAVKKDNIELGVIE